MFIATQRNERSHPNDRHLLSRWRMKDIPLHEVITLLSEVGYDAIEMMCGPEAHIPSGEVTDSLLKEVKARTADHGLKSP